ncbi:PulJ/GspJ family protein [Actinoplanes sp. URMC 104]|uniref:PulJ/GspJ family protein n=1 Tax=Actinoplanes sp. URMC 104 TaxID=3423409 RepID=UPI003F19E2DF
MTARTGAGRRDDDGFSLVEILVVLGIMSIVGTIFTTGILQIYRTAAAGEADLAIQSQLSQALLRLDNSLRYAYSIGAVHTEAGGTYVEYLTLAPVPGQSTYVKRCVQLRLTGADPQNLQLQQRSWKQAAPGSLTTWTPLAANLTTTAGSAPFVRTQPTAALNHQLLTVRLSALSGTSAKSSALTYTALNTYASTALDADGNALAATAEPCYDTAVRS